MDPFSNGKISFIWSTDGLCGYEKMSWSTACWIRDERVDLFRFVYYRRTKIVQRIRPD